MTSLVGVQKLAKDSSEQGRQELLRVLTDLFVDSKDEPSVDQNALFSEVVTNVLDDVATEARKEFSSRVAAQEHLPKDVAMKLAKDKSEIASPVLQHSPVLEDSDLVEICKDSPQQHLLAISQRQSIGNDVTDLIVARGNKVVVETMAANSGANFSPNGYRSLAQKARVNPALQTLLVDRTDMTTETAAALEPYLDAELRRRLANNQSQASASIPGLVEKAKQRIEKVLVGKHKEKIDLDKMMTAIHDGKLTLSAAVLELAKANKPVPLAIVMSNAAGVPEKTVSNALLKVNGMPLAIMCKALEIVPGAFEAIVEMRTGILRLPETIGRRLVEEFSAIDQNDARRTLEFLKTRQSMTEDAE